MSKSSYQNLHITIPLYLTDPLHIEFTDKTLNSITTKHNYNVSLIINHSIPQFNADLKRWQDQNNITIIKNPQGNILASAWNLGIKYGLHNKSAVENFAGESDQAISLAPTPTKSTKQAKSSFSKKLSTVDNSNHTSSNYVLVINNDIIFHPDCIDNLITFAKDHPEFLLWTATEWPDFRTLDKAKWDDSFSLHPHFSCFMLNQNTIDAVGWFDENLKGAYFEDNDYHIRILLTGKQTAATNTAKFYHYGSRTANIDTQLKYAIKRFYLNNQKYMIKKWGLDLHGHPGFSPPKKILKEIYKHPFNNPKKSIKDW